MEEAAEHYNAGLQHRDKALAFLKEASQPSATEKEKAKLESKAHKEFGKAIDEYRQATRLNPKLYQAHSDMGFAQRKTGDYNGALESYNVALSVAADYGPAIEYRGEAYLGLDRVEDAKQAYLQLFPKDRPHADELLSAMKGWVAKRQSDPGTIAPDMVQSFSGWVQEREELAKQTPTVSELQIRKW
jgi:tetratricopeptide (TPR) repeat protein